MEDTNGQRQGAITFRFKNVGPVKEAEVELGDFTIIAGRNNTGKTYLVYLLYGFLGTWKDRLRREGFSASSASLDAEFPDIRSIGEKVNREGRAIVPLERRQFDRQRKIVIRSLARIFSKHALRTVFNSPNKSFEDFSIDVNVNVNTTNAVHSVKADFLEEGFLSIEYDGSHVVISTDDIKNPGRIPDFQPYINHYYVLLLLQDLLPDPFILSAERFGISLFYKELDFTKNQLVDVLQKLDEGRSRNKLSPFFLIDKTTSRYALPIKDNIDYTRDIPFLRERKSEIFEKKLFDNIKDMMDGYYGTSEDDIRFISKARGKGRSFSLPLHLASSSARGLSDFYFFLKHVAKKNHLLIVDEPESHLDTSNQILLARLLARCVRAGLKVLITTHSDYLIKEINNLVMLSRPFKDKAAVIKRLKYSADDFLDSDSVRAYVAEDNSLTRCDVDRFGIDMPVFDETIDRINRVANDLASRMSEDSEA